MGLISLVAIGVQAADDKPVSRVDADAPVATRAPADSSQSSASRASTAKALPEASTIEFINQQIRQGWNDHHLTPSVAAKDGEWCRRVYLDVIGRIPTVDELKAFAKDRSAKRRLNLVNRLLGDEYVEEYARNWTTIWTNVLIGRGSDNDDNRRSMVNREGMQQYLRRAFQKNRTYDLLVNELISATGANQPGGEEFNGAVNFLTAKLEEDGVQATAKTAQVFLGMQVQCTQCHNHPFNDWKQNQFWELNAFFRQTRTRRDGRPRGEAPITLRNEDFRGEGGDAREAELYYELRNGQLKVAYPVFVDGTTEIDRSGMLSKVNRRAELARLVVNSDYMAKAMVNRMWAHFLGYGFTKPVDDMGPHNPPTHPELLDRLAQDFRKSSYDIKELIRWITLSEPYALSSAASLKLDADGEIVRTAGKTYDDPSLGEKPGFSHFYLRQMSAEQLYESLIVATEAQKSQGSYEEQEKTKSDWLRQFTIAFGTDEGDEATTFNGTIPQVLMMFNGDLVKRATSGEKGSFLEKLAAEPKQPFSSKANHLFLAALSRQANANELKFIQGPLFVARKGNQLEVLQDVWWVLLNSNEFILNH